MMIVPTKTQLLSYNVEHLMSGADHWEQTADRWAQTFGQVFSSTRSAPWSGQAAEAMRERTAWDFVTVQEKSDALQRLAAMARDQAQQLITAKNAVVYALDDAARDHFQIDEDWRVNDQLMSSDEQRQQQATEHAVAISSRVQAFSTAEQQAGIQLGQAGSHVHLVDWTHVPDHDPGGGPKPMPRPVPSCGDRQDDLWRGLISSMGVGAVVGGVMAGSSTEGAGAPQGALYGALGGGLTYLLKEAITGTPNCG